MTEQAPRVFISYAREDAAEAARLRADLLGLGVDPWIDTENLLPGQRWEVEIEKAIETSDYFIALLSTHSVGKRGYVQKELRKGLDVLGQLPERTVVLIPARLEECQPGHSTLADIQWVDLFPDWDKGLERIQRVFRFQVEALQPHGEPRDLPKEAEAPSLVGTEWSVLGFRGRRMTYEFRPDGRLHYRYSTGETFDNGTWKQSGDSVYIETNRQFAQYRGTLRHNSIEGTAENIKGEKWKWHATLNEL